MKIYEKEKEKRNEKYEERRYNILLVDINLFRFSDHRKRENNNYL